MTDTKNNSNEKTPLSEEMVVALIDSTRESLAAAVFRITELEAALRVERLKNESLLSQVNQNTKTNK